MLLHKTFKWIYVKTNVYCYKGTLIGSANKTMYKDDNYYDYDFYTILNKNIET